FFVLLRSAKLSPRQSILFPYTTLFRSSLRIGVIAAGIGMIVGIILGFTAGFVGGWVDNVIRTISDAVITIPALAVLIVISAYVRDRKSTRLNSSHVKISYAVFCLKKKI